MKYLALVLCLAEFTSAQMYSNEVHVALLSCSEGNCPTNPSAIFVVGKVDANFLVDVSCFGSGQASVTIYYTEANRKLNGQVVSCVPTNRQWLKFRARRQTSINYNVDQNALGVHLDVMQYADSLQTRHK